MYFPKSGNTAKVRGMNKCLFPSPHLISYPIITAVLPLYVGKGLEKTCEKKEVARTSRFLHHWSYPAMETPEALPHLCGGWGSEIRVRCIYFLLILCIVWSWLFIITAHPYKWCMRGQLFPRPRFLSCTYHMRQPQAGYARSWALRSAEASSAQRALFFSNEGKATMHSNS